MANSYKDLRAWKQSVDLALEIYRETQAFPKNELYGLTSQLRRAAVSVPSNIAEGKGRSSHKKLICFCTTHEARFWNSKLSFSSRENFPISKNLTSGTSSSKSRIWRKD
jgi:hypothetical protein